MKRDIALVVVLTCIFMSVSYSKDWTKAGLECLRTGKCPPMNPARDRCHSYPTKTGLKFDITRLSHEELVEMDTITQALNVLHPEREDNTLAGTAAAIDELVCRGVNFDLAVDLMIELAKHHENPIKMGEKE